MRVHTVALFTFAWLTGSCGSGQKTDKHRPDKNDVAYDVNVWIEADQRMPKELILKGCAEWKAKRVTCREVGDIKEARIRVYADDGECDIVTPDDGKRHTTLAWAYSGGDIKMMMRCLKHNGDVYDPEQLARVLAHEVGHQVGIWRHVPYLPECKEAKLHPSGKKVCGTAIMNPYDNPKVHFVTEIDALAFDVRDRVHSVLVGDVPPKDVPDCIYREQP